MGELFQFPRDLVEKQDLLRKLRGERVPSIDVYPMHLQWGHWFIADQFFVTCIVCNKSGGINKKCRSVLARFVKKHRRCGIVRGGK